MKTFLVSGAGSGIGRGIAYELDRANPGARLFLFGRNRANLEITKSGLRQPKLHEIVCVDQSSGSQMREVFQELQPRLQDTVGVIANAGISVSNQGVDENWQAVIETNLTGTFRFIQEALPSLESSAHPNKHIIIISSETARIGVAGLSAYCASKAGLLGLTRALAVELAPKKILVNAICPGWVDTPMAEKAILHVVQTKKVSESVARRVLTQDQPLPRFATPEEVGRLVAFLVSPLQMSMTGQSVYMNHGTTMA